MYVILNSKIQKLQNAVLLKMGHGGRNYFIIYLQNVSEVKIIVTDLLYVIHTTRFNIGTQREHAMNTSFTCR